MGRGGYVLLGVLWMTAGITMLGVLLSVAVRDAASAARNRIALTDAEWTAEGCLAQVRGVLQEQAEAAARDPRLSASEIWNRVDETVRHSVAQRAERCRVSAAAAGSRLDVNRVEEPLLAEALHRAGYAARVADSVAALIVERRQIRPFRHMGEMDALPGVPESHELEALLDVDPGPLSMNHIPAPVLATLPGFTRETVAAVVARGPGAPPFTTFLEMTEGVSPASRETLVRAIPHLADQVTFIPSAWRIRVDAWSGAPPVTVRLEVRLEAVGTRIYIARRQAWIP